MCTVFVRFSCSPALPHADRSERAFVALHFTLGVMNTTSLAKQRWCSSVVDLHSSHFRSRYIFKGCAEELRGYGIPLLKSSLQDGLQNGDEILVVIPLYSIRSTLMYVYPVRQRFRCALQFRHFVNCMLAILR